MGRKVSGPKVDFKTSSEDIKPGEGNIERIIKIGNHEIKAEYNPASGRFYFGKNFSRLKRKKLSYFTYKTNEGAFKTLNAISESFRDINPPKLGYNSVGESRRDAMIRDRLYKRILERAGYVEIDGHKYIDDEYITERGVIQGPFRTWEKKDKKNQRKLLILFSIIWIITGLYFLSNNLTGNVIGNMTSLTSNWIGGVLFIVGICGVFAYLKKR